jgi:type II secretory pathway pseudopilin PulG
MLARSKSAEGLALPEVVISAAIFVTVAAGVAPLLTRSATVASRARDQTMTAALAMSKLEQLRGLAWSVTPGSGGALEPMSDTVTDLSTTPAGRTGRGLAPSPPGSLLVNAAGYVDFLDAHGVWVGSGPAPPSSAYYVRRWAITPWPSQPDDALVLQVLASTLRADLSAGARQTMAPREGDAWLVSVHTRVRR